MDGGAFVTLSAGEALLSRGDRHDSCCVTGGKHGLLCRRMKMGWPKRPANWRTARPLFLDTQIMQIVRGAVQSIPMRPTNLASR